MESPSGGVSRALSTQPPEEWQSTVALLKDRKSTTRRSAAKRLRKMRYSGSGPHLLTALTKEIEDPRSWETQYQMVMALGESGCGEAVPFLQELAARDFEHTMLHMAVGDALARLAPEEHARVDTVRDLLNSQNPMLAEGGLRALAMTETVVPQSLAIEFIEATESLPSDERGLWCRVWVAAAAAGWNYRHVREVLQRWSESDFPQLQRAAKASLKGKYLKWSPL